MKSCPFTKAGFTLIELLIVIALLGALVVGMLAAVDPLEQIKKGTDTSTRNTVAEVYNAMIRYYAIKTNFPWKASGDSYGPVFLSDLTAQSYIEDVVTAGELKTDFIDLAGDTRLEDIILYSPDENNVTVCFQPTAKSFQMDANTKWTSDGSDKSGDGECKSESGLSDCWWCVK